jgi:beta-galactosidase
MRELIKQNCNHPSVCAWSLFNELWLKKDADEQTKLVCELNDLAHALDPTRPTTAATNLPFDHPANWITDVVAFNSYYGWYTGKPEDWPARMDELCANAAERGRAVGMSEYGAGASVKQHEVDPHKPAPGGKWHPEEWQCVVHEQAWKAMRDRPELWCKLVWVFADFPAAHRGEGDTIGMNDKGLVTFDRTVKKDPFYLYKANWSNAPFVHISSRRHTPRTEAETRVKVYSNCESVELRVNGKSVDRGTAANHVFTWDNVTLLAGENRMDAVGSAQAGDVTDSCTIVGR